MNTESRATLFDWAVFAALAAMALAPALVLGDSDFTYSDASRHAMDGVFVLDAIRELLIAPPLEWAKKYYATSPALGMGRYPPLLAVVEVPFYAALGVRPIAGRLACGLLWLAGLAFFYETARGVMGRGAGAFAAAALGAGPLSVRWACDVMLELPATAFLLAAAYFYMRYLGEGGRGRLTWALVLVAVGGWTKQPAAILIAAVVAHFGLVRRRFGRPLEDMVPGIILAAAFLVPLAALSTVFGRANLSLVGGAGRAFPSASIANWTYYIKGIGHSYLGWPLTVAMGAGVLMSVAGRGPRGAGFFGLWAAVFYLFFSALGYKSARLNMFWTPGLAFFAGAGLWRILEGAPAWRKFAAGAAGVLAVVATYDEGFFELPRPGAPLYETAAKGLAFSPKRIFYVGEENGTFVFRVRQLAGRERPTVVRDSKVLYVDVIQRELGRAEKAWTVGDLREAMARISPEVVVVERLAAPGEPRPRAVGLFLEYVQGSDFEEVSTVTARRHGSKRATQFFDIYLYQGRRNPGTFDIPMPGVGTELTIPHGR